MRLLLMYLLLIAMIVVKGSQGNCPHHEKFENRIRKFLEKVEVHRKLKSFSQDIEDTELSEVCFSYMASFQQPMFKITIEGCISSTEELHFKFPDITFGMPMSRCSKSKILNHLNNRVNWTNGVSGDEVTTPSTRCTTEISNQKCTCSICPTSSTSLTKSTSVTTLTSSTSSSTTLLTTKTSSITALPSTTSSQTKISSTKTVPITTVSSSTTPSSYLSSTKTTPSTTLLSQTSSPTTTSRTENPRVSSSSTSSTFDSYADEQREKCTEGQGQSVTSVVAIAVASFIAGVLVVLLCLWLLHLKRTAKLCFTKPETPSGRLTSDHVTKKVLAKHVLSERERTPASNNGVRFVNEPSKSRDSEADTDGMYSFIDQPELGQKPIVGHEKPIIHQPGTGVQTPDTNHQLYAGIQSPGNISTQREEEHVYNCLDQGRREEHTEQPRGPEGVKASGPSSKAVERLRVADHANSDVFDRDRDSTISGHDYFVLQNENFRTSHQPDVPVPDSATSVTPDATEGLPNTENAYFILEKQ